MANSTIKELYIHNNSLGGEAIQKFAELLQHNKTLTKLFIFHDDSLINSIWYRYPPKSLTNNQTMEKLVLPKKIRVKDTYKRVEWW